MGDVCQLAPAYEQVVGEVVSPEQGDGRLGGYKATPVGWRQLPDWQWRLIRWALADAERPCRKLRLFC